ncbi:hypothetical protein, partial [Agathobaculum sp.]|uniref:hypothetical protein n=1 Tax=Agathobaculum sp. TaxID=2048138 RepID=UPI003AB3B84A
MAAFREIIWTFVSGISRDSAHKIEFAVQIRKKSGRVPRSAAKKPRKDSADFLTLRGRKFWPSGGTFGRLWNG